jgi:hypothetical protein
VPAPVPTPPLRATSSPTSCDAAMPKRGSASARIHTTAAKVPSDRPSVRAARAGPLSADAQTHHACTIAQAISTIACAIAGRARVRHARHA